jgi:hypothetical protein
LIVAYSLPDASLQAITDISVPDTTEDAAMPPEMLKMPTPVEDPAKPLTLISELIAYVPPVGALDVPTKSLPLESMRARSLALTLNAIESDTLS